MVKVSYRLRTLSSLVASPRASLAWYQSMEHFTEDDIAPAKYKVIYPFYQYGTYEKYDWKHAAYYLPGSSIKGALRQGNPDLPCFMVDDIPIDSTAIVLNTLYKAQYMGTEDARFGDFFENVGVEMVKAGTDLIGEAYVDKAETFSTLLAATKQSANTKMKQMLCYWSEQDGHFNDEGKKLLHDASNQLRTYIAENDKYENKFTGIILLGGFKGLLHSIVKDTWSQEQSKGAIYLDSATKLPHGIVQMTLE